MTCRPMDGIIALGAGVYGDELSLCSCMSPNSPERHRLSLRFKYGARREEGKIFPVLDWRGETMVSLADARDRVFTMVGLDVDKAVFDVLSEDRLGER